MNTGIKDKNGRDIMVGDIVRTTHIVDSWRGVQEFEILPRTVNGDCIYANEVKSGIDLEHLTETNYSHTLSFGVWSTRPNLEVVGTGQG